MSLSQGKTLFESFSHVAHNLAFGAERLLFSLKSRFMDVSGLKPNWAIDRDIIIPQLREILPQRHMTKMNAAAFLCALSIRHQHSQYDPVNFLHNFLALYNAKTVQEVLAIEKVESGSDEFMKLWTHYYDTPGPHTKKMEAVKIRCWALDLERSTNYKGRATFPSANHKSITVKEIEDLLKLYPSKAIVNDVEEDGPESVEKLKEADGKETNSAFPKDTYLPMLREMRAAGRLNETQCGIILCFILHSREKRHDKKTSYVTHPMAVANLVRIHGARYLNNDLDLQWKAELVALLHDGGEKSNIDLKNDLIGLLPRDVIQGVRAVHKGDEEKYFHYLERCGNDILGALSKLVDSIHNMGDAGKNPLFKQAYVYPININYTHYRLTHPGEDISVLEFMIDQNICSDTLSAEELYYAIEKIADHETDKKKPASVYRDTLGQIQNLKTIKEILNEDISTPEEIVINADSRREENLTLHP